MSTVFITGATKNTGLSAARFFAGKGYDVAISSRSAESAHSTAESIAKEFGVKSVGYGLDLTDVKDIESVFGKIKKDFGRLDSFVSVAANLGIGNGLFNTTSEQFDDIIGTNVKGLFFCCKSAAEIMMLNGGGSIVTLGSVQGRGAVEGRTVYGTSKGAVSTLVKYLACELAPYGIRVNNVVAGAIHTDRWDTVSEEERIRRRQKYPLKCEASQEDVVNAIYYLATGLSSAVTGAEITVDSGFTACLIPFSDKKKEDK